MGTVFEKTMNLKRTNTIHAIENINAANGKADLRSFFGSFESLNNINYQFDNRSNTLALVKQIEEQRRRIAMKQSDAGKEVYKKLKEVGKLSSQADSIQAQFIEQAISNIYKNINESIGVRKQYSKAKKGKNINAKNQALQQIGQVFSNINTAIRNLENQLGNNNIIHGKYIDELKNAFNGTKTQDYETLMKNFYNLQGEILEVLGTEYFNALIPTILDIKAFQTGDIYVDGKQMAQDIIVFDIKNNDLNNIIITYQIGNQSKSVSIMNFLNQFSSIKNQKQSIRLSQEDYQKLIGKSVGGIQAKSGRFQKPWNLNKKTSITLDDLNADARKELYLFKALRDLGTWDLDDNPKKPHLSNTLKALSDVYNGIANKGIVNGKIIQKLLGFDINATGQGNFYLLTQEGFISYEERMFELLQGSSVGLKIQQKVSISDWNKRYNITISR